MYLQNGGSGFSEHCGEELIQQGVYLPIGDVCACLGLGSGGQPARSLVFLLSLTSVFFFEISSLNLFMTQLHTLLIGPFTLLYFNAEKRRVAKCFYSVKGPW